MGEIELICVFRILLAGICGCIVGLERKNRSKEAGIRTHCVVACGAAIIMIVSQYAFFEVGNVADSLGFGGEVKFDPSRVASNIANGIGFLGAGIIFVHKNTITGLTTAAGIWATSGIGMAIGSGLYIIGIASSVMLVFAQILLHKNFRWLKKSKSKKLIVKTVKEVGYQQYLTELLNKNGININDVYIEKTGDYYDYTFKIEIPETIYELDIISNINYDCKISSNL